MLSTCVPEGGAVFTDMAWTSLTAGFTCQTLTLPSPPPVASCTNADTHMQTIQRLIHWLNWGFTSHSKQNRSFRRRFPKPISLLGMEKNKPNTTKARIHLGFVELCAKILQIMRNDFKDYVRTFCQLFLPLFAKNLFRFCITNSPIQDRPILCLWDRQNSLPPSSKTSDFLYCLARSAALTLAKSWL